MILNLEGPVEMGAVVRMVEAKPVTAVFCWIFSNVSGMLSASPMRFVTAIAANVSRAPRLVPKIIIVTMILNTAIRRDRFARNTRNFASLAKRIWSVVRKRMATSVSNTRLKRKTIRLRLMAGKRPQKSSPSSVAALAAPVPRDITATPWKGIFQRPSVFLWKRVALRLLCV